MRQFLAIGILAAAVLLSGCGLGKGSNSQAEVQKAVIENIMSRKSVRSFTGEKLSEEQITTLLKAAMAAPSAINIQPWKFVVVSDDAVKQEIWGEDRQADTFLKAGAVFIVCGESMTVRKPFGKPDSEPEPCENPFWFEDCSAAAENLLLAAEAMGLGAVWTAAYPIEGRMKQYIDALNIPENVLPLCAIPVGYPAVDEQSKDKWVPENIHYNRW